MNTLLNIIINFISLKLVFSIFMFALSMIQTSWLKILLPGFFTKVYCWIFTAAKILSLAMYWFCFKDNYEMLSIILGFMTVVYLLIFAVVVTIIAGVKKHTVWFQGINK